MNHSGDVLKEKLMEMYPEIFWNSVQIELHFYRVKNLYIVTLHKECRILTTFLNKKDIDNCMAMRKPQLFDIQMHQFLDTVRADNKQTLAPAFSSC